MTPIPTLRWTGNSLLLIDQRKLPASEEYIDCTDVHTLAEAIRTLAVRGAPAIGLAAAFGAVIAASEVREVSSSRFRRLVGEKLDELESTRPTAVNLFHCLDIQRKVLSRSRNREEALRELLLQAQKLFDEDLEASRIMGHLGADLLEPSSTVLTHCNAGGLATSGLGTALAVVYEGFERGLIRKVYADETRPLLQGARLTSWELSRAGIPVEVLPDSAAAALLLSGEIDAVIVGSDRIAANGDAANKVGTLSLSIAAKYSGVPFYIVAPVSSFDLTTPDGSGIRIEERGRDELAEFGEIQILPDGVPVYNPAFDVTPAANITAIICEKGVIGSPAEVFGCSG